MTAEPVAAQPAKPTAEVPAADPHDRTSILRSQIDALDEGIIALVTERARLSAQVQQNRIATGGVRLELGRERLVVDAYRGALGDSGAAIAESVLRSCRGPL